MGISGSSYSDNVQETIETGGPCKHTCTFESMNPSHKGCKKRYENVIKHEERTADDQTELPEDVLLPHGLTSQLKIW